MSLSAVKPTNTVTKIDEIQSVNTSSLDKIQVTGAQQLNGIIPISGAKNCALKLMCAALLTGETVKFQNSPNTLRDMQSQTELLEYLGCTVSREKDLMAINAGGIKDYTAPYDIVRKMRGSILVLGPLLTRFGEARVSLPGGCAIGTRPVDMHIKALEELGAKINLEGGYINAKAPKGGLQGAKIMFPKVSVGATENLMMAATLANGETILSNAAREPEITDLGECLIKMGAKITGLGTDTIRITGVKNLNSAIHSVIPDRIETGTYMVAAAMTGGNIRLENARLEHLTAAAGHLARAGVQVEQEGNDIIVNRDIDKPLKAIDIMTEPHPGFPTDLQAQFMAMLTIANGASLVTETIFENRFMHVPELNRMGANITVQGNSAIVRGVNGLKGAEVMATDLRASVALVLAGLVADGETTINRIYHLERGYEDIIGKLSRCGAKIKKI
ncbi:MAG: UDP-N-acetylglucosamine 1-carboxyvinyltransferase [Micavibrio sp. TMED27]|nr:UDP-N-acetylglucosamine 1-carboxyvinyltransferase [Micavibrio sp.]OUT92277.1 MAG: UDP-N-acetylglucosamine 1-carboxyvinyltransferase [Micavibrio sp. TMED27]